MEYTIFQIIFWAFLLSTVYSLLKYFFSSKSEADRLFNKVSKNLEFEINHTFNEFETKKNTKEKKKSVQTYQTDIIKSLNQFKEEIYSTREKYISLTERYKHNKRKLKEIIQDWLDYMTIINHLQPDETAVKYSIDSEIRGINFYKMQEYALRRQEIIKRFDKNLENTVEH